MKHQQAIEVRRLTHWKGCREVTHSRTGKPIYSQRGKYGRGSRHVSAWADSRKDFAGKEKKGTARLIIHAKSFGGGAARLAAEIFARFKGAKNSRVAQSGLEREGSP